MHSTLGSSCHRSWKDNCGTSGCSVPVYIFCLCSCSPFLLFFWKLEALGPCFCLCSCLVKRDQVLSPQPLPALPVMSLVQGICSPELHTTLCSGAWWSFGITALTPVLYKAGNNNATIIIIIFCMCVCIFFFSLAHGLAGRLSFEFLRASCEIVWNPSNRKALIYYTVILMRTTPCTFHLKSRDL